MDHTTAEHLKMIFNKYSRELLTIEGVKQVAVCDGFIGVVLEAYDHKTISRLPHALEGYPVQEIRLQPGEGISEWIARQV
ncbi:MAG: hypothetical protein Q7R79_00070 [bacterium]|nr:hypothetical protein [bacterium]